MARENYNNLNSEKGKFINPYNFVPVDFAGEPERHAISDSNEKELKTGYLECELIAKSPLCIPDTDKVEIVKIKNEKGKEEEHNRYPFMRDPEGNPMIPGSSIRGTIRSVYEAATQSCMVTVDESANITYRTTRDAFYPGLLYLDENGEYHLFSAKRYIFAVKDSEDDRFKQEYSPYNKVSVYKVPKEEIKKAGKFRYGQKVYIKPLEDKSGEVYFDTSKGFKTNSVFIKEMYFEDNLRGDLKEGYICIGEPFGSRKHFESVFCKGREEKFKNNGSEIIKKAVKSLNETIKIYNDPKVNRNAEGRAFYKGRDYSKLKKGEYYPIWYMPFPEEGDVENIHLSVANIGRAAYAKTMGDKIGKFKACKDRENACPACRLFGLAPGAGKSAVSRVRVTDAALENAGGIGEGTYVTLRELAGPKTSYMPFYLRRMNNGISEKWSYDSQTFELRGRKFYWHGTEGRYYADPRNLKTKRNATVEVLNEGSKFRFKVYYDKITAEKLDALLWTLTLGSNEETYAHCHKIGHGKPIGLGSAKIRVLSKVDRSFDGETYAVAKEEKPKVKASEDINLLRSDAVNKLLEITDLKACKYPVEYPSIVKEDGQPYNDGSNAHASHQWFTDNFKLGKEPQKLLPEIGEQNGGKALLHKTCEEGRQNSGSFHGNKGGKSNYNSNWNGKPKY